MVIPIQFSNFRPCLFSTFASWRRKHGRRAECSPETPYATAWLQSESQQGKKFWTDHLKPIKTAPNF